MKKAEMVMGNGLLVSWNQRLNLFLCEREGAQWYWVERERALPSLEILKNARDLWKQRETFQHPNGISGVDEEKWWFLVVARETQKPTGGLVPIGDFVALTMKGDNADLEWLPDFFAPRGGRNAS